jgi:hypothetical protein
MRVDGVSGGVIGKKASWIGMEQGKRRGQLSLKNHWGSKWGVFVDFPAHEGVEHETEGPDVNLGAGIELRIREPKTTALLIVVSVGGRGSW